ncbi:Putative tyrosine-protein kinase in cps region [Cupriavidus laharis]|uniref:Tyrosine-protein kinase in cps region n=1 Tax=Cupriavidus laharis TaxID=151654 RepID=A0ABM8XAY8_9BURK|nr:polysaccharide biosynthesis tyrosine autokinase [Cupriavidus laharis]CAG9177197.1 Putative tyrosine-protein kinase in cps region [Cupriavidus laharis]
MSRLSYAGAPADREVPRREAPVARALQARALLDHMGWIVAAGVAGAAIGGMVALSSPLEYRAQALVQVEGKNGAMRNVAQAPQGASLDAGLLSSRAVVAPVVEQLHLDITARPLRAPLLGTLVERWSTPGQPRGTWLGYAWGGERLVLDRLAVPERLVDQPMLFEVLQDGSYRISYQDTGLVEGVVGENAAGNGVELRVARIDAAPGTRFLLTRHDPARTAEAIRLGLTVDSESADAGGSTVRIAWQYPDPETAAALVNGVTRAYISGQTAQRRGDAADSLAFLTGELPRVQAELARAEEALSRYRARTGSIQPSRDAQSFLNSSMEYQRQIAALRLERTKLLQRFTTDANEVKTVDSQIQQMTRERAEIDARMQSLSASERESVALARDVKVAEDMYMTLRSKVEQLSLLRSDNSSQMRVVDNAIAPVRAVGPGAWPFVSGGMLLGLCLGVAGVGVRQRLKPSVATANDAEQRLGIAMLGDVAFSDEQADLEREVEAKRRLGIAAGFAMQAKGRLEAPRPGTSLVDASAVDAADSEYAESERLLRQGLHDHFLLARRAPHSLAIEGLRTLRAALHFSLRSAPDGVVAVTSPAVGAGKTFSAVNLAVLFAEAGQRVLLVDADLRRGKIADWFDQPAEGGLAEVLAGRLPIAEAVRPTVVNSLFILTHGQTPPNPSELLMLPTLADNLRRCAGRFDLVIVDTPPVMAVADATLVASLAGSTLLVIRADVTPADQVNETLKRLARADARLAGGILNGVVQRRSNRADFHSINPYLGMPLPRADLKQPALTNQADERGKA